MSEKERICNVESVDEFRGHCGYVRTLVDNDDLTMHYVNINNAQEHAHPMAEYYQVIRGNGQMVLNGEMFEIKQGDNITVPAFTKHRAIEGKNGLEVCIVMMPTPKGKKANIF